MSKYCKPERAVFIGKASKYLASGALLAVFLMPTSIKADTVTPIIAVDNSPAANASSIIAAIGIQGSQRLSLPTIDANLIWVTAYASVPNETDGNPFITADGQHVRDGIIAANWLPFGTQVKMPTLFGNKIFTVEDRMNQAFNQRADIWMPTVTDALDFGIRHIEVVIVNIPQQSQSS